MGHNSNQATPGHPSNKEPGSNQVTVYEGNEPQVAWLSGGSKLHLRLLLIKSSDYNRVPEGVYFSPAVVHEPGEP
jgi:hypothetical protein